MDDQKSAITQPLSAEEKEALQILMLNIVRQIAFLPLGAMESILAESRQSLSDQDSIVSLIDPSRWMRQRRDGTIESVELQADIVKSLISIRRQIDSLVDLRNKVRS